MIKRWLKARVMEHSWFTPTDEGSPQAGVISPLLMNVALHGLEQAARARYHTTDSKAGRTQPNSPAVVRYADDLIACCHSQRQAKQVTGSFSDSSDPPEINLVRMKPLLSWWAILGSNQ
jgi:RNA-directed DNA polymerase